MTRCPTCGSTEPWYEIPEAGLLRCPNCFNTKTAQAETEKPAPKRKAKK